MKFSILCNDLLNILKRTNIVLNNNNILPYLKGVLFKLNKNESMVIGTNLITEITVKSNLFNLYSDGELIIPAKKLLDICKKIEKKSIIFFEKENNFLNIKSGKCSFLLINIKIDNFPIFKKEDIELEICILTLTLKNLIKQTYCSMGIEDTRKYLNGMLFEFNNNKFKVISTDGHRLSIYEIEVNNILKKNSFLISRQGINELLKFLDNNNLDEKINISFCKKKIYVKTDNSIFISRLLDEKFPYYDSIISKKLIYSIKLDKNIFNKILLRISVISNEKLCLINLNFYKNKLTIISYNSNQEKSEEYIEIENFFLKEIEIILNGTYLIESLSVMNNDFILFKFSNNKSSIYIEELDNFNKKHVIMPIYSA